MFENISLKDDVFNVTIIPWSQLISNIKPIFKLSGLSYKCILVWSNQCLKKPILKLVHMSLKFLLIYRFILPFFFFHPGHSLLKKLGHLSFRVFCSLDSADIISLVYVSLFPVFSIDYGLCLEAWSDLRPKFWHIYFIGGVVYYYQEAHNVSDDIDIRILLIYHRYL